MTSDGMTPDERKTEALDLAQTCDLIDALMRRFDHAVFSGVNNKPVEGSPHAMTRVRHFAGHQVMCVGLCHGLASYIQDISDADEEPISKDDL